MIRYSLTEATDLDMADFYGSDTPSDLRVSWAIRYDGEIACIAGLRKQYDYYVLFSNIKQNADYPRTLIYKIACWVITRALECERDIIAIGTDESHDFLLRLGLLYCGIHEGQRIYRV